LKNNGIHVQSELNNPGSDAEQWLSSFGTKFITWGQRTYILLLHTDRYTIRVVLSYFFSSFFRTMNKPCM
jgi:hypothetical protein